MAAYVMYSIDDNPDYRSFLPISIAAWNRLGWKTAVGYVNTEVQGLADNEISYFSEKIKPSRIAMPFRFCLPNMMGFDDDDLVMTADADSIILQAPWMDDAIIQAKHGKMVSIAHDWSQFNVVASWYVMATVRTWRNVIPYLISELIDEYYEELNGEIGSSFDERWLYRDIYSRYKERFHFIVRPHDDRINSQSLKNVCDIHCHLWDYRVFNL